MNQEELESIRQAHNAQSQVHIREEVDMLATTIGELARIIQANYGHIGGIALQLIPLESDALVNTQTSMAADSLSCICATDAGRAELLLYKLQDLVIEGKAKFFPPARPQLPAGMQAMQISPDILKDILRGAQGLEGSEQPEEGD